MVGEAIRKPEWEGCPAFGRSWEAIREQMADPRLREAETNACLAYARSLAAARVVLVSKAQLRAVSKALNGHVVMADEDHELRLPFDPLFVDVDDGGATFLVEQGDGGLQITPSFPRVDQTCFVGIGAHVTAIDGTIAIEVRAWTLNANQARRDPRLAQRIEQVTTAATYSLRALLYLLSAAEIDLAEPSLPRQARRRAARKGHAIPLVIKTRRSTTYSAPRGGSRDYSHQHERAGNFAHNFETIQNGPRKGEPNMCFARCAKASPHKVLTVRGMPCIRSWRPPCWVGPEHLPPVPKVRDARSLTMA